MIEYKTMDAPLPVNLKLIEYSRQLRNLLDPKPFFELNHSNLCLKNYILFLKYLYRFHLDLELNLLRFHQWEYYLPDIESRNKHSLLLKDLQSLHVANEDLIKLEPYSTFPIDSFSQALGVLLAIENLQGRRIIKSTFIARSLELSSTTGTCYISGYGEQFSSKWNSLQMALDLYLTSESKVNDAFYGIKMVFSYYDDFVLKNFEA
jgi:heme oxygenase